MSFACGCGASLTAVIGTPAIVCPACRRWVNVPGFAPPRRSTHLPVWIVVAVVVAFLGISALGVFVYWGGAKARDELQESKRDVQRELVHQFVSEGYVDWARHHPTQACPASLMEVADELGRNDILDAWGRDLIMFCGDNLPPGARRDGFAVMSLGPDGQQGTKDDITSWE